MLHEIPIAGVFFSPPLLFIPLVLLLWLTQWITPMPEPNHLPRHKAKP